MKKRKKIQLLIVFSLLFISVISSSGKYIEDSSIKFKKINSISTVYVDDNNTDGPWNGSMNYPYKCIQDAVNSTKPGSSIYVFNGTYHEHLQINKTITLIGEDKNNTIIDGNGIGSVIFVRSNWTNITGFTIQNCSELTDFYYAGIVLSRSSNNSIYKNNIIKNKGESIYLRINSSYNKIFSNNICNNKEGIRLNAYCSYNEIFQNNISNIYHYGIVLSYWCNFNNISRNHILGNITSHHSSIRFFATDKNTVYENIIEGGEWGTAFSLEHSHENLILRNSFIGRNGFPDEGIKLNYKCHKNKIYENNFINHSCHANFGTSFLNHWYGNYWDDWFGIKYNFLKKIPKIIKGDFLFCLSSYNFDWHPASEPYEI